MTQAFVSPRGERKLLLINKRQREPEINLAGLMGRRSKDRSGHRFKSHCYKVGNRFKPQAGQIRGRCCDAREG